MSEFASNGLRALKLGAALALAGCASGCVTTVLAVGANAATVALSDKTAGEAIDDSAAAGEIRAKLIQGKGYALGDVQVAIAEGFVLLTGTTPTPQDRIEAERRAWTAAGTRSVANEIVVGKRRSIPAAVQDNTISAQVRSKYLNSSVKGLNYTIETNQKTVYLLGIARSRFELTDAVEQARTVRGVQKVVSYVRVMDKPVIEKPETAAQAAAARAQQLGLQGGPQPDQTLPYGPDNPAPAQPDYAQYDYPATPGDDPYAPPPRAAWPAYAAQQPYSQPAYSQQPGYAQPQTYRQAPPSQPAYNDPYAPQAQPSDVAMNGSPASGDTLGSASNSFAGETRAPVQEYGAPSYNEAPAASSAAAGAGPVVLTPQ